MIELTFAFARLATLLPLFAQVAPAARDASSVVVVSATTCPTAAEVDARLRVLLPAPAEGAAPRHASLVADAGALHVRLTAADGTALGERTVTVAASCADRANVVAVVIAAWDVQLRGETLDAPSFPRAAPARAPGPTATVTLEAAGPVAPSPPPTTFELTLGPAVTFLDGGVGPAGVLTASAWRRRLGARLGLFGLWPRTDDVGAGRARWTRAGATLELGLRARGRAGRLDAHAGVVAAALVTRGQGYDVDQSTTGLSPGLVAGVDWSYAFGRLVAGAGATLAAFPAQRLVFASSPAVVHALPRWQPSLDLHAGFLF